MDRELAFKIFGLAQDATEQEINRRFGILAKRCRSEEDAYVPEGMDKPVSFAEIQEAYNCIMNIDTRSFADTIEDEEERNAYIAKEKAKNFWYYNKVIILLAAFMIVFLIWGIVSIASKEEADLNLVFYGAFVEDQTMHNDLEKGYFKATNDNMHVAIRVCLVSEYIADNTETRSQFNAMLATKQVDVIVTDYEQYEYLVRYGILIPLDEYLTEEQVRIASEADNALLLPDANGQMHIYGFNVEGTDLFTNTASDNTEYIVSITVGANPNGTDNIAAFVTYIWDTWYESCWTK
ncbi:MAG: hypothetical protein IKV30_05390 [Clostridia bacterium]|nr:hypothetical protein [Clostridia bacterium]